MRLNIKRPDGVSFSMNDTPPPSTTGGQAGPTGGQAGPTGGTQIAPQMQAAIANSAMAPAPVGPTAPDDQLLQQAMAGMMPTADRPTFNSGQEAMGMLKARQAQQEQELAAAQGAEDAAVADALDAQARESDLMRLGRLISSLTSQAIVPPGHRQA